MSVQVDIVNQIIEVQIIEDEVVNISIWDGISILKNGVFVAKTRAIDFTTGAFDVAEQASKVLVTLPSGGGGSGSGSGTVSSVGGFSPLFTVNNPTSTPTFTAITQNANLVFAGPSTGSAAAPTFRALVAADIPSLPYATISGHVIKNSGSSLTQRANLNFTNGLTATDASPNTNVTLGGDVASDVNLLLTGADRVFDILGAAPETGFEVVNNATGDGASIIMSGSTSTDSENVALLFDFENLLGRGVGAFFDDTRIIKKSIELIDQDGNPITDYSGFTTASLVPRGYVLGAKTYTGLQTFRDDFFILQDNGDLTKQANFQLSSITAGNTRTLTVPNASGTIAVSASGNIALDATTGNITFTGQLPVANGGTSFSSYITGDLIQASAAGTLAKLNSVATGNVLISGGVATVSSWGKVTSSHIDATVQTAGLSWLLASGGTATGTNTFAMGSNPFIMTSTNAAGTGATAAHQLVVNSLTTGNGFDASSSSVTTGFIAKYTSTSTAINHTAGTHALVGISSTGANGTASKTTVGFQSIVGNTGTTNTNYGAYFEANGASSLNRGIWSHGGGKFTKSSSMTSYDASLNAQGNISITIGSDTGTGSLSLNADRQGCIQIWHPNSSETSVVEEPINLIQASSSYSAGTGTTSVSIGGRASGTQHNAVTTIKFYTAGNHNTLNGTERLAINSDGTLNIAGSLFIGGATSPTAKLHLAAGTATALTAPLKIDSSGTGVTGLLTTAEKGAVEFTDRGLWFSPAASTRHKVFHGLVGATAPATNAIGVIADYYGTSGTRVLTTPSTWVSFVGDDGNTYKLPAYS